MEGGKLSTQNLKGLLDASYDPRKKKVGDFVLDKELSSGTSKVYRNPKSGQVVVAHRGTAGIMDWGNNAVYALGGKEAYKLTPRYKEAEKVQRRTEKKYGASNVSTIGHSQGGLQSELLGGRSKEIITLNKATRPFESNRNKNQFDVRSDRDVVSGLNPFARKSKKDVNIKAQSYNPLTEHSGDVLNRLGKNRQIGRGVYIKGFARIKGGVITPPSGGQPPPPPPPPPPADVGVPATIADMTMVENNFNRLNGILNNIIDTMDTSPEEDDIIRDRIAYLPQLEDDIQFILEQFPSEENANLILEYYEEFTDDEPIVVVPSIRTWRGGFFAGYFPPPPPPNDGVNLGGMFDMEE